MDNCTSTMAQRIARAASAFEQQRTGHAPQSASVILNEDTLVIMLRGALSPAEKALAQSPAGAAQMQTFHRQLFINASQPLRREIKRITGVDVREATAEVEMAPGVVTQVFATGTVVQVFSLARRVAAEVWNDSVQGNQPGEPRP